MLRFIVQRLLLAVPTLLVISFLVFGAASLAPGDPVDVLAGEKATDAVKARVRKEWGLDRPFLVRYADYVTRIVTRGDFGRSYMTREPVTVRIARGFPNTAALAVCALTLALAISVPVGVFCALHADRLFDRLAMGLTLVGVAIPPFVLGPVLVLLLAIQMKWLPVLGFSLPSRAAPQYFLLPSVVLALRSMAYLTRLTRSAMLEALGQDYIRTARAKGLSPSAVLFKHALKNAFPPILTVAGITFGYLLSGSFIVETFFAIPGIGNDSVRSILNRDYPVIQGMTLLLAFVFVVVNLVVDILYGVLDPRARAFGLDVAQREGMR